MPREFSRRLRVAAELQRLLNELLYAEVKDPRLAGVTISEVELSGDLGVAKVYFSTLDPDEDPREAEVGFAKATGFMRSRIGHSLRLRRVPELKFVHDVSARRGAEISRLIDSAAPDADEALREPGSDNAADAADDGDDRDDGDNGDDSRDEGGDDETGREPPDDDGRG